MKIALALALLGTLSACSAPEPVGRIYRYAEGADPASGYQSGMRYTGGGTIVDHLNHDLSRPEGGQRWLLVPGNFLLVTADGTIVSAVPAKFSGS
ncbi:RcnB family protein [Paracoccus sp. MBLB3053]|uniref:RcnB family protein n=1 Tax=Paracoccus aurantius TaxID=3073814 RepID=A0ABU2HYI0_9RHOB|nr:RcnB family protein [Paracoccus sp. MBLB3053]MDS9470111.1 RcnB family protein [Paracoccus sp. MBLB3053]